MDFTVSEENRRTGDPAKLFASSKKAARVLGWKPCHSEIEDIVSSAWNWHRFHPDGYTELPEHSKGLSNGVLKWI